MYICVMVNNHKKKEDSLTSGLAAKTCSNCLMTSGGVIGSSSAPSIAIGILTPERKTNK
jgi:hypothetical protein